MRYSREAAAWQRLGGAVGAWLLALTVGAQTLPVPSLPPPAAESDLGTATPGTPPSGAQAFGPPGPPRPRAWEYAVGAGLGWDSNIDFLVPDGPQAMAVFPRGGVARVFSGPHAQLRATAAGLWTGYPEERDLSRYHAEFGLDGVFRPSAGTTWRANASHGSGHSDSSRILLEQGVSLPVVKMRSSTAAVGLRKAGTRRALRLDARFYRTEFD